MAQQASQARALVSVSRSGITDCYTTTTTKKTKNNPNNQTQHSAVAATEGCQWPSRPALGQALVSVSRPGIFILFPVQRYNNQTTKTTKTPQTTKLSRPARPGPSFSFKARNNGLLFILFPVQGYNCHQSLRKLYGEEKNEDKDRGMV